MNTKKAMLGGLLLFTLFGFKDAPRHSARHRWFNRQLSGNISIVITKSKYELQLFDEQGWYATYPAVFGNKTLEDKMVRGDRKTPEGIYHIVSKRPHEKWDKIMDLDYPTSADMVKFRERQSRGLIPKNASPGDGIAIHGTWPHDEMTVDNYQNWTNGCISLKCEDMDEVYSLAPVGTRVTILH